MKDILFYLLIGVLFYYILSRSLEYYNLEQENFDPSLVPVSSIVTLAKVAQKLVTGGVLTNPGSLQIGTSNLNGAGNLLVTGNSTVNGNNTILGNTTLANVKINPVGTTGNTIVQYGDGTGKKIVFQKDDANPQLEIFDNKKVNIKGNLNVDGILSGNTTVVGTNPTNFGQTTIDGGKITVGDTNNSVEKLVMPTGTAIRIIGKDGGALSTSTTNPLLWDNTGLTSNNLKVLGTLITPSISATPASTNIKNLEITGKSTGHTFYITGSFTNDKDSPNRKDIEVLKRNTLISGEKYLAVAQITGMRGGSGPEGYKFYFDNAVADTSMPCYIGYQSYAVDIGGINRTTEPDGYPFLRTSAYAIIIGPEVKLLLNYNSDDNNTFKILIILTQINSL